MRAGTLFLGLGKVTRALSAHVSSPQEALVEKEGGVEHFVLNSDSESFVLNQMVPGTFDSLSWERWKNFDIFLSPGIDPQRKFFSRIHTQEIRELDFVSQHFQGLSIVITGTDGKSTFTTQLGEVLRRAFPARRIFVGGNLGTAAGDALKESYDLAVLEVSSFQAERLNTAQFDFGILINLAPDHLDRYPSLQEYFLAKWHLLSKSKKVFFPEDQVSPLAPKGSSGALYKNSSLLAEILQKVAPVIVEDLALQWKQPVTFEPSWLMDLPRLPHRQEVYQDKTGALFVDDSKATTVHAMIYAVQSMRPHSKKLKLILGGRHKGDNFEELKPWVRPEDKIFVCGEARKKIEEQIRGITCEVRSYQDLATLLAAEVPSVASDEVLVLSPGCSSYDEFDNFEERGKFFVSEVSKIRSSVHKISLS